MVARLTIFVLLSALFVWRAAGDTCAADIRTWAFEATVVHFDDRQGLFGDVRLGDPVRGDFAYDISLDPTYTGDTWDDYDHPSGFYGIRLSIDNPRTMEDHTYAPQTKYSYTVSVFTDHYLFPGNSAVDFWQDATAPWPGVLGLVYIDFSGPAVLSETTLPTHFNLEDWEFAAVYLNFDSVVAQIHTLTPIIPGDLNRDGQVNVEDYDTWRVAYGSADFSSIDGNRNGTVDAADYTVWRDNLRTTLATAVPEPFSLTTAAIALVVISVAPRQRIKSIRPVLHAPHVGH